MAERNDEAWRALLRSLVSGIAHDLNGRLTALGGVAHMARTAGLDGKLMRILDEEVQRLASSTLLLRALPLSPRGDPEPVRLGDVLPEIGQLYAHRSGPRRPAVRVEGDASVIARADSGALAEATLLLLAAAEATSPNGVSALVIQVAARGEAALVQIEGVPRERSGKAIAATLDAEAARAGAQALIESSDGRLTAEVRDAGTRYTIELPRVVP